MDDNFFPQQNEDKTSSTTKRSFRFVFAGGLIIIALIGTAYLSYPQILKRLARPKPIDTAATKQQQSTPPGGTSQIMTAKIQSSVLLSKYGQLEFPELATSTAAEISQIPDDMKTLLIGVQNMEAEKLSFKGQATGIKIKFQLKTAELKPVFEKIVQITEAEGLQQNAAARTEKFAFSDFQSNKFAARLSLTLENNSISGEILAIYK